jgi:hypothetical protein
MDTIGDYHVKQNKPGGERQIYTFSHVQNLELKKQKNDTNVKGNQHEEEGRRKDRVMGGVTMMEVHCMHM